VAEHIEISLPAQAPSLSFVRLNVGAIAARMELGIDELEDLQLAVEELCLMLLRPHATAAGRLHLFAEWDADALEVRCRLTGVDAAASAPADGVPAELSRQILEALVDEHGESDEDGIPIAWLKKRREQAASA
jgi:hypothetical protein